MHITLCVKIEIKYLPMLERAVGARLRVNTECTSRCTVYKRVPEDNLRYNRYEEKAQVLMLEDEPLPGSLRKSLGYFASYVRG